MNNFSVQVQGNVNRNVFNSLPLQPDIQIGGLTINQANVAFNLAFNVNNGSASLALADGDVKFGFTHLTFGPVAVDASVTLGKIISGQFVSGTSQAPVGGSFTVTAGNTTFGGSGTGSLSKVNQNTVLSLATVLSGSFDAGLPNLLLKAQNFKATFDLELAITPTLTLSSGSIVMRNVSADLVEATVGPADNALTKMSSTNTTWDLTKGAAEVIKFGSLTAKSPALATFAGFTSLSGTVSNFAIGPTFNFIVKPGFSVSFSPLPTAKNLGLPDWFPLTVTKLGLKLGPSALNGDPSDVIFIVSGNLAGTSGSPFPIHGQVDTLAINVKKLSQGQLLDALDIQNSISIGIDTFTIGSTMQVGGGLTLGTINVNNTNHLYGEIDGYFSVNGIGGGISLIMTEFGPLLAKIDAPLGIPLGPTGLLLEGVSGGFRFGGDAFKRTADPLDLLRNPLLFNPVNLESNDISSAISSLVTNNITNTMTLPFTAALQGQFTTVATPGIFSGNITLGINLSSPGNQTKVVLLGSGDASVYGVSIGKIGSIIDLSTPQAPVFQLAMALPDPTSPLTYLVPVKTEFSLSLDTTGLLEAPLVGLRKFVESLTNASLITFRDTLASALSKNPRRPLSILLGVPLTGGVDGTFVVNALKNLLPTIPALTANTPPNQPPVNLTTLAKNAAVVFGEMLDVAKTMTDAQRADVFSQLKGIFKQSVVDALNAGWTRFNPKFTANGMIQPVLLGFPIGQPDAAGSVIIDKGGMQVQVAGSIQKTLARLLTGGFDFGQTLLAQLLSAGFSDQVMFTFGLSLGQNFLVNLINNGSKPNVGIDADWTLGIGGTLKWLGFPLGNVLGLAFRPQSPRIADNVQLVDQNTPVDVNKVPIDSITRLQNLQQLGGLIATSRYLLPQLLVDPVALLKSIDFSPLSSPTSANVQAVVDQLTHAVAAAQVQLYIPSFEKVLRVDQTSTGTVISSLSSNIDNLLNAAYFAGFTTDKILGISLLRSSVTLQKSEIDIQAQLPWLLGTEVDFVLKTQPIKMVEMVESLAKAAGFNLELSNVALANPLVPVPVAKGQVNLDSTAVGKMLAGALGLPTGTFTVGQGLQANLAIYTPAFADPSNPSLPAVQRNGGIEFNASMDVPGFVDDATAHFEMPLFTGNFAPDFSASLDIKKLSIPGFGPVDPNILSATLTSNLSKKTVNGAATVTMDLSGQMRLLNLLDVDASGSFTVDTGTTAPGLFGQASLKVGGQDPTLGGGTSPFTLSGTFDLQVNTTSIAHDNIPRGPYLAVHVGGNLNVLGVLDLSGSFDFVPTDQGMLASGDVKLKAPSLGINDPVDVSIRVLIRADGRIEGTFEGAGLTITLDRFGCLSVNGVHGPCDTFVYVDPVRFTETNANQNPNLVINLSQPAGQDEVISYTIAAVSGSTGLTPLGNGTVTITKNSTKGLVKITVVGENVQESPPDRKFTITIDRASLPSDVKMDDRDQSATITIHDDDSDPAQAVSIAVTAPTLSPVRTVENNVRVLAGSLTEGKRDSFTLAATNLDAQDSVVVRYTLVPKAASLLTPEYGSDMTLAGNSRGGATGEVTLVGSAPQTITINTIPDSVYELNEQFELQLEIIRPASKAPITAIDTDKLRVTIVNDDQDRPGDALVFYDFDSFPSGKDTYDPSPDYTDPLLVVSDFRHSGEVPASGGVFTTPTVNSALRFNGGVDFARSFDASIAPLPTGAISADFWVNPTAVTARQTLLHLGSTGLRVFIENGLFLCQLSNTSGTTFAGSFGTAKAGVWQHVTVVYDGSKVSGYINGALTGALGGSGSINYGAQSITLGSNSNLAVRENLDGLLDEVRIWSAALSSTTVGTLNKLNTTGAEANLLIDYRLDEGRGNTAFNSTGKGWALKLGSTISTDLSNLGLIGRPEWVFAGDSPIGTFSRYRTTSLGTSSGVPKIPPVSPTANPSFGINAIDAWAPVGASISTAPYYYMAVARDVPVDSSLTFLNSQMRAVSITAVDFFNKADVGGPTRWELRSSRDNFSTALASGTTAPGGDFIHQRVPLNPALLLIHPSEEIEFRLYGLDASGSGQWRVDDFALIGSTPPATSFNHAPTLPLFQVDYRLGDPSTTLNLSTHFSDPDGDAVNVTSATIPAGTGTLTRGGNSIRYSSTSAVSPTTVTLNFIDRWGAIGTGTYNYHLLGNAVSDSVTTPEDTAVSGNLIGNDRIPTGQAVTVSAFGALPTGVSLSPSGTFTYNPPLNSNGTISFSYNLIGLDWTDTAAVTINVTPVNDLPQASDDSFVVTSSSRTLSVAAPGVLSNDTDADGDAITAVLVSPPANGSLSFSSNGSFTYTPNSSFGGTDTFTYRAKDGVGTGNLATVSIRVGPQANPDPTVNGSYLIPTTSSNRSITVNAPGVLANDSGVSALSAVRFSDPSNGTLTLGSNGSFTYIADDAFAGGLDSFTYRARDIVGVGNVATVNIQVPFKSSFTTGALSSGSFAVSPSDSTVASGASNQFVVEWTVPTGSWHVLKTIDFRLRDPNGVVSLIRFDEAAGTFSLFNTSSGKFGPAKTPGSHGVLSDGNIKLQLDSSSVRAAGAGSPTVFLLFDLIFQPSLAGRVLQIEVAASDDLGHQDSFAKAGLVTVAGKRPAAARTNSAPTTTAMFNSSTPFGLAPSDSPVTNAPGLPSHVGSVFSSLEILEGRDEWPELQPLRRPLSEARWAYARSRRCEPSPRLIR